LQIDIIDTPKWSDFASDKLGKIKAVTIRGKRLNQTGELYSLEPLKSRPADLTAIPYYAWGNRGKCKMKVWLVER